MYRVARQAAQQPLQRSPSGSSLGGLPPSYPVSAAASRSNTEDGSVFMPVSSLRRQGLLGRSIMHCPMCCCPLIFSDSDDVRM